MCQHILGNLNRLPSLDLKVCAREQVCARASMTCARN